jgi:hypothetical protein
VSEKPVNPFTGEEDEVASFDELVAAFETLIKVFPYYRNASRGRMAIEGYAMEFYPKEWRKYMGYEKGKE